MGKITTTVVSSKMLSQRDSYYLIMDGGIKDKLSQDCPKDRGRNMDLRASTIRGSSKKELNQDKESITFQMG